MTMDFLIGSQIAQFRAMLENIKAQLEELKIIVLRLQNEHGQYQHQQV